MDQKKEPVILVIDDEEFIRKSFKLYLEDQDFTVMEADNGKNGIEVINKKKPDLIIVDLRMPVMNGFEFIGYARASIPDIPLIVISGTGNINELEEAVKQGASLYLLKPIKDLKMLKSAILKVLDK